MVDCLFALRQKYDKLSSEAQFLRNCTSYEEFSYQRLRQQLLGHNRVILDQTYENLAGFQLY